MTKRVSSLTSLRTKDYHEQCNNQEKYLETDFFFGNRQNPVNKCLDLVLGNRCQDMVLGNRCQDMVFGNRCRGAGV
jgi:hypothetical protein